MSKQINAQPQGGRGNKPEQVLAILAKMSSTFAKKWAKLNAIKMVVLGLIVFGAYHILNSYHALGCTTAALYLFANDGKISGRQSGSVKTRNGIERMFAVPRLVRNSYTTVVRGLLSSLSSLWNSLSDSERQSWLNVDNVFKSNRFGVSFLLKGKQLFVERNANLINVGQPGINAYLPSIGVVESSISDAAIVTTAGVITTANIVFTGTPVDATTECKVYATAPLSPGVSRPKPSALRQITVMPNGSTTPFNILTAYVAKFGNVATIGQKIGLSLSCVNNTTGQMITTATFVAEIT